MVIRCVCLGLLTIILAGCNKANDHFISFSPVLMPQDHDVSYPLLQLQLDEEIRSRLTAQIAEIYLKTPLSPTLMICLIANLKSVTMISETLT